MHLQATVNEIPDLADQLAASIEQMPTTANSTRWPPSCLSGSTAPPQVLSSLRTLVLDATRPAVGDRLASIGAFLDKLAEVERAVAEPDQAQELDPLKALPGTVFRSRYRLQRRLVSGGATNWDAGITVNASFNVEVYGNACPATTTGSPASSRTVRLHPAGPICSTTSLSTIT
jgi:hypothetical protein